MGDTPGSQDDSARYQETGLNQPPEEKRIGTYSDKEPSISVPSKEEKVATGEGIPLKTVQAGPQVRKSNFGPGNDGEGGDYFVKLQERRAKELDASTQYQIQYPKDPLGEKHSEKAFFSFLPNQNTFQKGFLGVEQASISGRFHLRYSAREPLHAKNIWIVFEGHEDVFWENRDTQSNKPRGANKNLCSFSVEIWRGSNNQFEKITHLDLPFDIPIPENLPSSIELPHQRGKIYYKLKASILRHPNLLQSDHKHVEACCLITRYASPHSPDLTRWIEWEDAKLKGVGYDVSLPFSSYSRSSEISVPVKLIFYKPLVYLKSINVAIKEYREIRQGNKKWLQKKYVARTRLAGKQVPALSDSSANVCSTIVKLMVPEEGKIFNSLNSNNITISHKLKVKIMFGRASNVNLAKEIKIENLLSEEIITNIIPQECIDQAARLYSQSSLNLTWSETNQLEQPQTIQTLLPSSLSILNLPIYSHSTNPSLVEFTNNHTLSSPPFIPSPILLPQSPECIPSAPSSSDLEPDFFLSPTRRQTPPTLPSRPAHSQPGSSYSLSDVQTRPAPSLPSRNQSLNEEFLPPYSYTSPAINIIT
ncbi:hypothetical protein G9A89_009685 [Geosiphon pyriformis]|nr:hypothetical protein G9A89_009685 [Geosiphon pyriformis]